MNCKNQIQILLGKMYRGLALSALDIKEIIQNPIEKVIKCEMVDKEGIIYYKFYLENDAQRYTGEIIF